MTVKNHLCCLRFSWLDLLIPKVCFWIVYIASVDSLIKLSGWCWCPVMITHRADSDWETISHHDNRMSSFKSLRTPGSKKQTCMLFVWSSENIIICIACSVGMHIDAHLWQNMFVLNISLWFYPHVLFTYPYSLSCFLLPSPSPICSIPTLSSNSSLSAMQEDALKLVLLALEDGSALSRKVLVLFVVQKLEARFPQASKTSIGHVVQLLYRASCFKVLYKGHEWAYTHSCTLKLQIYVHVPEHVSTVNGSI